MIVEISAAGDTRLDDYRHVGDHRWLRDRGLFVAEGRLLLERLVSGGTHEIRSVLVSPAARAALDRLLASVAAPVYVAPQPLLNQIAGFNFHRGCLALASRTDGVLLDRLLAGRLLLGIQGVSNPDNLGGLVRTAAALGADGIVLDERCGDPYYRKAVRTSMGAVLHMPRAIVVDWSGTLDTLRKGGFEVAALTPAGTACPLDDYASARRAPRLVVLVGAEGSGLTPDVLCGNVVAVRIPMCPGVDSLNVVVAAGIALSRLAVPAAGAR